MAAGNQRAATRRGRLAGRVWNDGRRPSPQGSEEVLNLLLPPAPSSFGEEG